MHDCSPHDHELLDEGQLEQQQQEDAIWPWLADESMADADYDDDDYDEEDADQYDDFLYGYDGDDWE